MNKTLIAVMGAVIVLLAVLLFVNVKKAEAPVPESDGAEEAPAEEICILYTNDVHCGYDENMGYEGVAAAKDTLEKLGKNVILVDAGDATQGALIGLLTDGSAIIDIMNEVGYSAMAVGNHEFDYGVENIKELAERADFDIISCNFLDKDGNLVFTPYTVVAAGDRKVAFIGISTPRTPVTTMPSNFKDSEGNQIYSFSGENGIESLSDIVNRTAADAREQGADYVIALSHMGENESESPFTTQELAAKVSGVDAYIDAHSHSVYEKTEVTDADGRKVPVSQTGTKLQNIGLMTIRDGVIDTKLITNEAVRNIVAEKTEEVSEISNEVVAYTDVDLYITDPATGKRRVRQAETNLADLVADSLREYYDADVAVVNGGGVRADLKAGTITFGDIISVCPFSNDVTLVKCTGQKILDALEISAASLPDEFGGFLQVSGMTYEIDMSVEPEVTFGADGMCSGIGENRRVGNVMIAGEPIDPGKEYLVTGVSYVIEQFGDGNNGFEGAELVSSDGIVDNQILINYIINTLGGVIGDEYADPYGDGRIRIIGK